MITRLIWTIWTSLSAVPRMAVKFNYSLTHSQIVYYCHVSCCRMLLYLNLLSHDNIFKSFLCSVNSLTLPLLDLLNIWIRAIIPFISLFWLQQSLVFIGNIYAMYLFLSLPSLWRCYLRWLHRKVSFRQITVPPVTRVQSEWRHFRFSEPSKIIVIVARWCVQGGGGRGHNEIS